MKIPKECWNCVDFCNAACIDLPCKGNFDCEDRQHEGKDTEDGEEI